MKGRVTNSDQPARLLLEWDSRRKWPSQWRGWSTCPYIIVEDERSPTSCAVLMTSSQGCR
ncbi:hypothetical protein SCALM49S_05328 [Streptomyces californicus]